MTDAVTGRLRRLACALLTAVLAGCAPAPAARPQAAGTVGTALVLRVGGDTGTPSSRQFAAMLPLTLRLTDAWGQAKVGRLPHAITARDGAPVHDPAPGEVYLWPSNGTIAVYYDDLGQTVPGPGLVRLGVVDAGLDRLASARGQVTVRFERR
ncbi:cyclophilin-like fold protein [Nonomuraea monospora]